MIEPDFDNLYNSKMEIVKFIPYIPNMCWCMEPTTSSWHMVDPIENLPNYNRDSINMRISPLCEK